MKIESLEKYRKQFQPGDILLEQGDHCDGFYLLGKGKVSAYVGDRRVGETDAKASWEFIGEVSALLDTQRQATVVADNEVSAFFIPNSDLERLIANAPSFGIKLARSLSRKLLTNNEVQGESANELFRQLGDYVQGLLYLVEKLVDSRSEKDAKSLHEYLVRTNPWGWQRGEASKLFDGGKYPVKSFR